MTSPRFNRLSWAAKAFYVFATTTQGTWELNSLRAVPRRDTWTPVRVEPIWEDKGSRLADVDVPYNGHLIVRERVHERLRPVLEPFGELLPLECEALEPLWVFNPTRVVDALDGNATRHHVYPDGRYLITGSLVLKADSLPDGGGIFRVPQALQGTDVFYMQDVVTAIRRLKLSGLGFTELICT